MHGTPLPVYVRIQECRSDSENEGKTYINTSVTPVMFYVPHEIPWRKGVDTQQVIRFMLTLIEEELPFGIELYEGEKKIYHTHAWGTQTMCGRV